MAKRKLEGAQETMVEHLADMQGIRILSEVPVTKGIKRKKYEIPHIKIRG